MAVCEATTFAWVIYLIDNEDGTYYLGASRNVVRRMGEHRKVLGRKPRYRILEHGYSIEWRSAEHRWIEKLRADGIKLINKTAGRNGVQIMSAETLAKLLKAREGYRHAPGVAEKIASAQRGVPKQWSPEGRERIKTTQFKPGRSASPTTQFKPGSTIGETTRFTIESAKAHIGRKRSAATRQKMSDAQQARTPEQRRAITSAGTEASRDKSRAYWAQFTPEQRSAMLRERQLKRWARRSDPV